MPGRSGVTVVTMLVCFILFCTRGCGRIGRPAFPAPSEFRGQDVLGKPSRAGAARSRKYVCEQGCLKIASEESGLRCFRDYRLRDARARAARTVGPLPPCGGELERGVVTNTAVAATPLPNPPPQGGRERGWIREASLRTGKQKRGGVNPPRPGYLAEGRGNLTPPPPSCLQWSSVLQTRRRR